MSDPDLAFREFHLGPKGIALFAGAAALVTVAVSLGGLPAAGLLAACAVGILVALTTKS